jgi:hypothetical protein
MEVVRSATTSSCLTHRIPPGPSSGSHTAVRARCSTRCFPATNGVEAHSSRPKALFGL